MGVGVDGCMCFHIIYSYIATADCCRAMVLSPLFLEYHSSKRPIEQDNPPVLTD